MEIIAVVSALALAQYLFFGAKVGAARAKYEVKAPAITGNENFERVFRVQQNTLEQLIVFIPALWMFATYVHVLGGAALGVVYLIGRILYFNAYINDPSKRTVGFVSGYLATVILLLGGLGGAAWSYFS